MQCICCCLFTSTRVARDRCRTHQQDSEQVLCGGPSAGGDLAMSCDHGPVAVATCSERKEVASSLIEITYSCGNEAV